MKLDLGTLTDVFLPLPVGGSVWMRVASRSGGCANAVDGGIREDARMMLRIIGMSFADAIAAELRWWGLYRLVVDRRGVWIMTHADALIWSESDGMLDWLTASK